MFRLAAHTLNLVLLLLLSERLNREGLEAIRVTHPRCRKLKQLFRHHLGHRVFPVYQAQRLQHVFEDLAEQGNFLWRKRAPPSQEVVNRH